MTIKPFYMFHVVASDESFAGVFCYVVAESFEQAEFLMGIEGFFECDELTYIRKSVTCYQFPGVSWAVE